MVLILSGITTMVNEVHLAVLGQTVLPFKTILFYMSLFSTKITFCVALVVCGSVIPTGSVVVSVLVRVSANFALNVVGIACMT